MEQPLPGQEPKQYSPSSERPNDEIPRLPYNLNAITVYASNNMFLLDPSQSAPMQTRLLIDRRTGKISELDFSAVFQHSIEFKKTYSAFIGIMNILEKPFLVLVDEAQQVCKLGRHKIYTITSVSFIPFESSNEFFNTERGNELIGLISNIRKVLSQGFYFAYSYDLTLSKTRKINATGSDPKFMWNHHMYRDFPQYNISSKWQLPLIQGYVGNFTIPLKNKPLRYYIISRRSCLRAGTRTFTRGLDDDGNTANLVETEQIAYYNGFCCAHTQIRGNPPVFFTGSACKVTRNVDLTTNAFLKHLQSLEADWGYVLCLNLLTSTKKEEQAITDVIETMIRQNANALQKTRYEFLDYLNATKGQKYEKVNIVIQKLKPLLENMQFYAEDEATESVKLLQKGILRTSCIDALDRTNAFQTKVAIALFDLQLRQVGVDLTTEFTQDPVYQLDNDNMKQQHPLLVAFRDLWNENGDCLSMLYAGYVSSAAANAKSKDKSFFGFLESGIKNIPSFNMNPIDENVKQEGINLLLGQHTETLYLGERLVESSLKAREKEFAKYEDITVFITTWNVGNYVPPANFNFTALFDFEDKQSPDIVAIGLQEHIELSASNVVVGNDESIDFIWQELLLKTLRNIDKYIVVHKEILVGILLIIFIKDHLRDRLNNLDVDVVKTGLAGTLGNKGAVVMKFNIDDSSLCFINCHMEAGGKQNNVRLANVIDFHQKAFQQNALGKRPEDKIMNMDYKFLFGDTNFRLNCSYIDARAMIDKYQTLAAGKKEEAHEALQWLLDEDQLLQSKGMSEILDKYQEGKITFLPTYKYDPGTDNYDTSKKQRTPSWTDRVLWRCDSGEVRQSFYHRREFQCSDHRPVVSYFTIRVKKIDKPTKKAIVRDLHQNLINAHLQKIQQDQSPVHTQNAQNLRVMTQDANQSERKSSFNP